MGTDLERLRKKAAKTRPPLPRTGILERRSLGEHLDEPPSEIARLRIQYLDKNQKVIKFPDLEFITNTPKDELEEVLCQLRREGLKDIKYDLIGDHYVIHGRKSPQYPIKNF